MELTKLDIFNDDRGSLVEAYKLPKDGQINCIVINPKETRGNHYHLKNIEKFLVVYGVATIDVKNRETGDMLGITASGAKPILVTVVPNHTHRISTGQEGAVVMIWSKDYFDRDDPDTFPEEI